MSGDFPTNGETQPTPTGPTPTPTNTGSVLLSRPSVWLAGGTMALLIVMTCLLALHKIPTEQMDAFNRLLSGLLLLFGIMVRDVFHGDTK